MFGHNPIRKIDHFPEDGRIAVQEVFYTLQGEGPFAGAPAVFIRLAGCHLACTFCDTEFESGINNRLTVQEIVRHAALADTHDHGFSKRPMVVLTGGEPMRQPTVELVRALLAEGFSHVQYETAGNLWEPGLEHWFEHSTQVSLVVSPKTPHVHPMVYRYARHWKYIVRWNDSGNADGLPDSPTQKNQPLLCKLFRPWDVSPVGREGADTVWVSPCDEHDVDKNLKNVQQAVNVALRQGYRLSMQMHKLLNLP